MDLGVPMNREYRDYTGRIVDLLAREYAQFRDCTFIDCTLEGPAVLRVQGVGSVDTLLIEAMGAKGIDSFLFQIEDGRESVGPINVVNCSFVRCTFRGVGFMGDEGVMDEFRLAPFR